MPEPIRYEAFAHVLKHAEGGWTQKNIRSCAKASGVRVTIHPSCYVGNHQINIETTATKAQRKKLLKYLDLA